MKKKHRRERPGVFGVGVKNPSLQTSSSFSSLKALLKQKSYAMTWLWVKTEWVPFWGGSRPGCLTRGEPSNCRIPASAMSMMSDSCSISPSMPFTVIDTSHRESRFHSMSCLDLLQGPLLDLSCDGVVATVEMHVDECAIMVEVWLSPEGGLMCRCVGSCSLTWAQVLSLVLPSCLCSKIDLLHCQVTGREMGMSEKVSPSPVEIMFSYIQVLVEPLGLFSLNPLSEVRHLHGVIHDRTAWPIEAFDVRCNHKFVDSRTKVFVFAHDVLRVVMHPLRGGAKDADVRMWLVNQLTAKKVPESRIEDRTMTIISKLGYPALKACLGESNSWAALKAKANDVGLVLVRHDERAGLVPSDEQKRDWWAPVTKTKGKGKGKGIQPTSHVKLDMSFFRNNDGSHPCEIGYDSFVQNATGILVLQHDDLRLPGLLAQISKKVLSADELGLVIVGTVELPADVKSSTHTVPAAIDGKPAAILITLVQCGDNFVSTDKASAAQCEEPLNTVVMVQVLKDGNGAWPTLDEGPELFLRTCLGLDRKLCVENWAFGFYKDGRKLPFASRDQASYAHWVARVPENLLHKILRLSGTKGIFIVSKGQDGQRDSRFRVLEAGCRDLEKVRAMALGINEHFGIVKVRGGFGIRIARDQYKATKKSLFPDDSTDDDMTNHADASKFALLNVPEGFAKSGVRSVLRKIGWNAQVLFAAGVNTWHVIAPKDPPSRAITFDGKDVVIMKLGHEDRKTVLAASDRKTFGSKLAVPAFVSDCNVPQRQQTGPQKAATDAIAEKLSREMQTREERFEGQYSSLARRFDELEKKVNDGLQGMSHDIDTVKDDIGGVKRDQQTFMAEFQAGLGKIEKSMSAQQAGFQAQMDAFFSEAKSQQSVAHELQQQTCSQLEEIRKMFGEKCRKMNDGAADRRMSPVS